MRKKNVIMRRIVLLCGTMLIIGGAWGASNLRAKYVSSVTLTGEVDFSPSLASDVTLLEHTVERKADGSYQLKTSADTVNQNEYKVMPGVDIPKDPFITITDRSNIPAYLYVEVLDSLPSTVTYDLTGDWQKMTGVSGKHGGNVYVYAGPDITVSATAQTIKILQNDLLTVSELYSGEDFSLDFYAYLYQKLDTETSPQVTFARASNEK